jgi:hypothetical protein
MEDKNIDLDRKSKIMYIMSESSLAKDWLTEEEDGAWRYL